MFAGKLIAAVPPDKAFVNITSVVALMTNDTFSIAPDVALWYVWFELILTFTVVGEVMLQLESENVALSDEVVVIDALQNVVPSDFKSWTESISEACVADV